VSSAVDAATAGIEPFDMTVHGAGAFPSPRRPSVVWVGIEADERLAGLQAKIEAALESIGFPREDRPFAPHLTIGRAKRKGARPPEFQGLDDALARLSYEDTFRVSAVDVMRSHLMPGGAVYEVVHGSRLEP
jgi:2'-5' RNA ligase